MTRDRRTFPEHLLKAAIRNQVVEIWYTDNKGLMSRRKVEIYGLNQKHLFTFCQTKQKYRLFKMSNIWQIDIIDDYYEPKKQVTVAR